MELMLKRYVRSSSCCNSRTKREIDCVINHVYSWIHDRSIISTMVRPVARLSMIDACISILW